MRCAPRRINGRSGMCSQVQAESDGQDDRPAPSVHKVDRCAAAEDSGRCLPTSSRLASRRAASARARTRSRDRRSAGQPRTTCSVSREMTISARRGDDGHARASARRCAAAGGAGHVVRGRMAAAIAATRDAPRSRFPERSELHSADARTAYRLSDRRASGLRRSSRDVLLRKARATSSLVHCCAMVARRTF
jgi:hypothetical protein